MVALLGDRDARITATALIIHVFRVADEVNPTVSYKPIDSSVLIIVIIVAYLWFLRRLCNRFERWWRALC